jgi:chemotaxis protein histidine kinase CheA
MSKEEIQYVYSGRFDAAFLDEMYAGDIQTAAEIFESSLNHLVPVTDETNAIFRKGDVESLRKLFHKIKPLYGYVGLLKVQAMVQHFEDACTATANTEDLKTAYEELVLLMTESINIIRQELIRMKMYLNVRA